MCSGEEEHKYLESHGREGEGTLFFYLGEICTLFFLPFFLLLTRQVFFTEALLFLSGLNGWLVKCDEIHALLHLFYIESS